MENLCDNKSNYNFGKSILAAESDALSALAERLGTEFSQAVQMILDCKGTVLLTGLGKSGIIAQKISATLASTGTLSFYLHPSDSLHGDLGRVQRTDIVIVFSYGGETYEITRLLDILIKMGVRVIGITALASSTLARKADMSLLMGEIPEACPLGLAPTTTSTCMLALGDALAMTVLKAR